MHFDSSSQPVANTHTPQKKTSRFKTDGGHTHIESLGGNSTLVVVVVLVKLKRIIVSHMFEMTDQDNQTPCTHESDHMVSVGVQNIVQLAQHGPMMTFSQSPDKKD